MTRDLIKAVVVLAMLFAALMMFCEGVEKGKDLMAVTSVFLGLAAWCMAYKWSEQERDRKSGIDKAVRDERDGQDVES